VPRRDVEHGATNLTQHIVEERRHDLDIEICLGPEMVVDHRFVDSGRGGDSVDPGTLLAVGGEFL